MREAAATLGQVKARSGLVAVLFVLALAVAGCGGDDDDKGSRAKQAKEPNTETARGERSTKAEPETETESDSDSAGSPPPNSDAHSQAHAGGEAGRVRARLAQLFKGVRDRDARTVCSILTRDTRKLIGSAVGRDCTAGMDYAFGFVPKAVNGDIDRIRITRVAVKGKRATATVRYPRRLLKVSELQYFTRNPRLKLVKERGEWRVPLVAT